MRPSQQTGQLAEDLAADYLAQRGFKILARNLKTKLGEIDILAKDKKCLVLVEVKSKTSQKFGLAVEMINPAKQRKLGQLFSLLETEFPNQTIRVDVVAVDWSKESDSPAINHIVSAIEG